SEELKVSISKDVSAMEKSWSCFASIKEFKNLSMFEDAAKLMREMRSRGFEYDAITYSSIFDAFGKIAEDPIDQA
ncbi:pentatricopeptide repeat-containing protein, partial [Tanacetum coccineum]